jgi:hypothetical protein
MAYPLVGILVLNWNNYRDTKECLDSLSKVRDVDHRIYIVDNNSNDGSIEKLGKEFPHHIYIKNRENLGFAGGNNVGIKQALAEGADYILLLNNDTEVNPDFLSILVHEIENDPKIGAVGPKIYYHDNPKTIWFAGGKINPITGQTCHIGINKKDQGQYETPREVDFITGCAFFIRAEVLNKIGLFDNDYFYSYEDVDLSFRIRDAGYKLVFVPRSVVYHKFARALGGRFSPVYIYYRVRNSLLFDIKNKQPKIHFIFHLFFMPIKHVVYGALTGNFKGVRAALRGLADFLAGKYGKGSVPACR